MKIYALYSIKGGVGKTASAVNLAYLSALSGARTLIWDLDPQGAASYCFRIRPETALSSKKLLKKKHRGKLAREIRGTDYEGLDLLPADFSYRHLDLALDAKRDPRRSFARLLEPLAADYDRIYLDCAPSISLTSESLFAAADALLVPTIPAPLSLRTLEQLERHLRRDGPEELAVLPFFCMVDRRKKLHREARQTLAAEGRKGGAFLDAEIPFSTLVERMSVRREPLLAYAYKSDPAQAYVRLWHEVESKVGG